MSIQVLVISPSGKVLKSCTRRTASKSVVRKRAYWVAPHTIQMHMTSQERKELYRRIRQDARHVCFYCGKTFPPEETSVDHKIPLSLGGNDTLENLVCSCVPCNSQKGAMTDTEFQTQRGGVFNV